MLHALMVGFALEHPLTLPALIWVEASALAGAWIATRRRPVVVG